MAVWKPCGVIGEGSPLSIVLFVCEPKRLAGNARRNCSARMPRVTPPVVNMLGSSAGRQLDALGPRKPNAKHRTSHHVTKTSATHTRKVVECASVAEHSESSYACNG